MRGERRERLIIAVLAGSGMLTSLQFTLIVPALHEVPGALDVGADDAGWLVTITLLTSTVGTPIAARAADMIGRRRMLIVCLALLVGGSVLASLTSIFAIVLIGRAAQGFATAIVPIGISIMRERLGRERAATGTALMSATIGIGSAIGLPLSGVLLAIGGLPLLFTFSAVVGTVFLVLVVAVVPASGLRTGGRFDVLGAALLTIGLAAALLVISKGMSWGWTSPVVLALAAVAIIAFATWVPQQLRTADAVVDLRTAMRRPVLQTNIASMLVSVGMFANHLLTVHEAGAPRGTGVGLGLPPVLAGLVLAPSALALVALSPVAGRILGRIGGRLPLALGATIMALAFALRLVFNDGVVAVALGALGVGVGIAFAFAAMPTLIMDAVPAAEAAAANGVNGLVRSMAGAITSAGFAFMLTAYPWSGSPDSLSAEGLHLAFAAAAVCATAGALVAIALPRSSDGRARA